MKMTRVNIKITFLVIFFMCSICGAAELLNDNKLQAVYKYSVQNGLVDRSAEYTSENRLLLLQISSSDVYFETELAWANGHSCYISGIATIKSKQLLTYYEPSLFADEPSLYKGEDCNFHIYLKKDRFIFGDENTQCRMLSCGNRGLLDKVEFKYNTGQKITPALIKKTPDFIDAINTSNTQHPSTLN